MKLRYIFVTVVVFLAAGILLLGGHSFIERTEQQGQPSPHALDQSK